MTGEGHRRVGLVTGGTSGIGAAVVRQLTAEGFDVIATGRNRDAGERLVAELSDREGACTFFQGDVGEASDAAELAEFAEAAFGHVDALVLNAGIVQPGLGPFWQALPDEFDEIFRVNVRGVWLCARAIEPLLGDGAAIVVTGSIASHVALPGEAIYSASKGAVLQLARGMALDLASRGIRVNVVCPGFCDTPMTQGVLDAADDPGAKEADLQSQVPLGRMASSAEIAKVVSFLVSDSAAYCTGSSVIVDGGFTAA